MTEPQTFTIQLAFVDADEQQPDPATVGEVARQTITDLRNQDYTVQPAYTGAKGGNVFAIATQLGQHIVENKELLIALLGLATPILTVLLNRYEKRLDREEAAAVPPSPPIFLTINHATVPVEAADLDDNGRLLHKLLAAQPDLIDTVTPESTPQIEVRVPRKPQRRRR